MAGTASGGGRRAPLAPYLLIAPGILWLLAFFAVPLFTLAGTSVAAGDGPWWSAYARAIEGAEMILMLSSMLHAIGTGNMTPAGVRVICVDISPAVVTKLADRGSLESVGIVTDVGLFLNLLAQNLVD